MTTEDSARSLRPTPTVVIVGRPNVGKSTLFNRLVGERKALVHNLPGVTRDRNMSLAEWDGILFRIVDTGGILGEREDPLVSMVEEQVGIALEGGDIILLVTDSQDGLMPVDEELAARLRRSGKPAALVVNKVDVQKHEDRVHEFHGLGLQPLYPVSAEHGGGVEALASFLTACAADLEPSADRGSPDAGDAIKVAIVGKPNVGKSSILNRLIGEERALVSDLPGTTRDPVDSLVVSGDDRILLVDTAGLRRKSRTERGAEMLSMLLARRSLESCRVALLVLDASRPPSHQDMHIAGMVEGSLRAGAILLNKWDLVRGPQQAKEREEEIRDRFAFVNYLPVLRVSAKTGRNVDAILPVARDIHGRYVQDMPTSRLNETLQFLVRRTPPPAVRNKELKIRYGTQTGHAPPILTLFTNSRYPPPRHYSRYLKKGLRKAFDLEGSPLVLKFRRE